MITCIKGDILSPYCMTSVINCDALDIIISTSHHSKVTLPYFFKIQLSRTTHGCVRAFNT